MGKFLHLVILRVSFSRRNLSNGAASVVRTHIVFSSYFIFSNLLLPVIFTWRKPENLVTLLTPRGRSKGQGETAFSFSFIVSQSSFFELLIFVHSLQLVAKRTSVF